MPLSRRRAMAALAAVGSAIAAPASNAAAAPLAAPALPADAAVLRRLRALRPNQGADLGKARVVGEFNEVAQLFGLHLTGPQARDYSLKMPWAGSQRRALYLGANHAVPHRLNDVWEFDLAAMAWVLLYAPDHPRSYAGLGQDPSDVVFRDGVLSTQRGGPAVVGHTWSGVTWDPVRRLLLFMNPWAINQDPLVRQVGADPTQRYAGPPMWAFDPATGAWQLLRAEPPWPGAPVGALLEHVPELAGSVWHMNNWQMQATWLLDSASGRWSLLAGGKSAGADFVAHAPGREAVGYHDARRRLLVVQHGRATHHFDTVRRRWRKVLVSEEGAAPDGHDARNVFYFDAASGQGLLVDFQHNQLWAYDPDAVRWQPLSPAGDPMPVGRRRLAYTDQMLKVLVIIDDTRVWAWRSR